MNELNELKRRLSAVERKPDVLAKFDRYPTTEWAAVPRSRISWNPWSSCGIANVTGLVYDRVECKFVTDNFLQTRAEGEVRLAAFRHFGGGGKECVSASRSFIIRGGTSRGTGLCVFRWIHGIPFGWDYEDGTATYTIELQHRYRTTQVSDGKRQIFAYLRYNTDGSSWPEGLVNSGDYWAPGVKAVGGMVPSMGWQDIDDRDNVWDGSYSISNMHYCVGLPEERIPGATTDGWAYYTGGLTSWGSAGNINDEFFSL
ncbi:hypothetical protein ACFQ8S_06860 [Streptomyces virginiae]|uniref:hypothetical protein n=1 Tax=Streptomyces virginiae TaxID=1961 RepID=UPI00367F77CB